jgi:hypothetical protein
MIMVMTMGMLTRRVNNPITMNRAQKNSAKMASNRDVVVPIPPRLKKFSSISEK